MDEGHRTSERRLNVFQGLCEILKVYRGIVQLVERWSPKPNVEGSSPSVPALYKKVAIKLIAAFFNGKTGTDVVHFTVPAYPAQLLENKRQRPVGYDQVRHLLLDSQIP